MVVAFHPGSKAGIAPGMEDNGDYKLSIVILDMEVKNGRTKKP
jgi:hypothetical protein